VREDLAAALRGEEAGIACSEVPIGNGVNARNIERCLACVKEAGFDGVISIECYGSDANIRKSQKIRHGGELYLQ